MAHGLRTRRGSIGGLALLGVVRIGVEEHDRVGAEPVEQIEVVVDLSEASDAEGAVPADVVWRRSCLDQRGEGRRRSVQRGCRLLEEGTGRPEVGRGWITEAAGWLRRRPDPEDLRGRVLTLTDSGRRRCPRTVARLLAVEDQALAELAANRRRAAHRRSQPAAVVPRRHRDDDGRVSIGPSGM